MPDEKQAQTTGETHRKGHLSFEESQRLLALGFDPVAPVYPSSRGFDQDRIRDALFESQFSDPVLVPFEYTDRHTGSTLILPMEVEVVQRVLITFVANAGPHSGQRRDAEEPEWYLRGLLAKSQLNPDGEIVRMHAYIHWLQLDEDPVDNNASIQILRERPTRTPAVSFDGWIVESDGPPTLT